MLRGDNHNLSPVSTTGDKFFVRTSSNLHHLAVHHELAPPGHRHALLITYRLALCAVARRLLDYHHTASLSHV
eukprot:scaffold116095_cov15-Prasinocladus_malaysianus.AAC.1